MKRGKRLVVMAGFGPCSDPFVSGTDRYNSQKDDENVCTATTPTSRGFTENIASSMRLNMLGSLARRIPLMSIRNQWENRA
jgi:hypothetical protein